MPRTETVVTLEQLLRDHGPRTGKARRGILGV
jgi:hypothetical protein